MTADTYGFNKQARRLAERIASTPAIPPLEVDFPYTVEMFPAAFFGATPSVGEV